MKGRLFLTGDERPDIHFGRENEWSEFRAAGEATPQPLLFGV